MKNSNSFEPVYLRDAKRHIDWLYKRIKTINKNDTKEFKIKKISTFSKFLNFLKRVF